MLRYWTLLIRRMKSVELVNRGAGWELAGRLLRHVESVKLNTYRAITILRPSEIRWHCGHKFT